MLFVQWNSLQKLHESHLQNKLTYGFAYLPDMNSLSMYQPLIIFES